MFYKDLEKRREKVRKFIRNNPNTTYRDLRNIGIKIDKVYKGKMAEAYRDSDVKPPRTFKFKTKNEKRNILINFIRRYPNAGSQIIRNKTKINYRSVFGNIKELFDSAGVFYPRGRRFKLMQRDRKERKKVIIKMIKENPLAGINEIMQQTKTQPYRLFKNMREIYQEAGITAVERTEKWRLKKRKEIINFIKGNPMATQREINKACHTKVQTIFQQGIFDAYKEAKINYPYKLRQSYGVIKKEIKERARNFEDEIAIRLSGYGVVSRLVKTKRGFVDIILERKGKKSVIEVKDYQVHEISVSQIKQLNKYLEDCNCNLGFLVCRKKPKKDRFLIDNNKIFVIEDGELGKVPKVMDKGLW